MTARTRRPPTWLLNGLLPFDRARVPTDVIAGGTLAALAIPEVMGYTKIAGMPVVTGLYTLLLPVLALRASSGRRATSSSAPTRRRPRSWPPACVAIGRRPPNRPQYVELASLAALMCAVLLIARPAPPARVHRQLPVPQRPHRLPDRRRHPGRDGPGRRACSGSARAAARRSRSSPTRCKAIPTETSVPTLAVSIAVLVTIVGLERVNKKIPGALIAVVGAIAVELLLRPRRPGRHRRSGRSRAACPRSACRPTS